jgi:hypothetical protein
MKQYLFLIAWSLVSFVCGAQDTLSKWSFGGVIGVERQFRTLNSESALSGTAEDWDDLESPAWRISGGFKAQWSALKRLSISSGLVYVDRGYGIDSLKAARMHGLEYHFRYIDIPVAIHYTGRETKKNRLFAGAGLNTSIPISNVLQYRKDGQSAQFHMSADDKLRPVFFNVSASLGIRRSITNTATIDLYLNGNQALQSYTDGPLERRFNSVGIFISILNRF